ncbi:MAG: aspartate aminotransferase family protein [Aestuariivirga sp.]|uniref:aspartate aminotransferase family protein n=1 Tax=Aestuariivirga sp. TaxID=2650926 RepID=UPI0025BA62E5|nr:aspartate aminotransferase family protein [Aestuariivirga sp.]MCA3561908.1 aspartate aminotransferase family protein [Aestuariivirga sp.]
MTTGNSIYARDGQLIAGLQKLRFFPLAIEGGDGAYVIDEQGRRLLDLSAAWGAASLGYGHPAIVEAVTQAVKNPAGASILSATHRRAVDLAERILATLPELADHKVWFGHSGSDANETAFRAIAAATGRPRVIAFRGAYHGGTAGSMAISGHAVQSHAARAEGLTLIPYPNPYRGEDGAAVLAHLAGLFATTLPPAEVGALFIEPIQSDGGLIMPPPGFLKKLAGMCRAHGILIVCDEVKVGLGRTGQMHCFRHEGFTPDLVCLGKGLGGGLAISALAGPRAVMDHATSFAMQTLHGNPVSVATASAVLSAIEGEGLAENAATVGTFLREGLEGLKARHPSIGDVRGRGLAIGVELVSDRMAKTPSKLLAAKTVYRAFELGLVLYYVGLNSNVLELTPPLVLTRAQASDAISLLDRALSDVEQGRVSDDAVKEFVGW